MYTFNREIIEQAREKIKQAYSCYEEVWDKSSQNSVKNLVNLLDDTGEFQSFKKGIGESTKQLMALLNAMEQSLKEYEELDAKGKDKLNIQGGSYRYGVFGDMWALGTGVSYAAYQMYQFESKGTSLATGFNDLEDFMGTLVFECASIEAGMGEWNNWGLWLDSVAQLGGLNLGFIDEYTDDMLESALSGILMAVPDSQASKGFETLDQLETYSGIENLDKWIGSLKKLLSTYAQSAKTFDEIKLDKNFKKLMGELPKDLREMLGDAIGSIYSAQIIGDTVSELTDKIERLDMYIDVVMHCFNDYSVQVSYLDGLENALAAAGFPESAVTDKIRELKETYQSDVLSYALNQVGDLVTSEIKSTAIQEIIKKAAKEFPGIKGVLWGVDWVSAAAKVQNADEISAIKGLGGLYQFDHVLTSTYENYAQMMNAGIATQADLEEAERIFTLLKQTKIQEYEHMLTLCENRDTRLFEKYHFKYYQLTGEAWNGHSLTSSWQYVGSGT